MKQPQTSEEALAAFKRELIKVIEPICLPILKFINKILNKILKK